MIIKKPYAFLIKKFRLIHTILFVLLLYIAIKTFDIYTFFNDYAINHVYLSSGNLASSYISVFTFIIIVIAILFGTLIYYILSIKNKRRNTYLLLCIYYILMFIFFIFIFNVLQKLNYNSFDVKTVRAIRDIMFMVLIPQIIFLFIIFSRALGFNIKSFDFKKDLEEMQIDKSDYEEVEVTLGNNNYKFARFFRKTIRLLKYFVLENKFIVIVIASIALLITSLIVFLNLRVYNINYNEKQELLAHQLWYTVTESVITNTNMNGVVIDKNKSYVIVKLKIDNKYSTDQTINRNTFKLEVNNDIISPKLTSTDSFLDLGDQFSSFTIRSGEVVEKTIIFEIDNKDIKDEYIFKIKNFDNSSFGSLDSEYKDIIIKPKSLTKSIDKGKYQIPTEIKFNDTVLDNTVINISNYQISEMFKEKYDYCLDTTCYKNTYVVKPMSYGNNTILRIESNLNMDKNVFMNKYIKKASDFYKYYSLIKYRAYGVTKSISTNIIQVDYDNDKYSYIEVPKELENANKIELILTIRGVKYTIVLK